MSDHPINSIMNSAMENLKQMVEVDTIIGDAITSPDGTVIIPVDPPSSIELGICLPSLEDAAPAVREFVIFAANQLKVKIPEQ